MVERSASATAARLCHHRNGLEMEKTPKEGKFVEFAMDLALDCLASPCQSLAQASILKHA